MNNNCENIINDILNQGGKIICEKQAGETTLFGRTIIISKGNCKIKIGYMNLGDKQLLVEMLCSCYNYNNWKAIPTDCKTMYYYVNAD